MIESLNNERVKNWAKLSNKKYQSINGLFLVEGIHLVIEASKCGCLEEVIILKGNDYDFENKTYVTEKVIKKISGLDTPPKIIGIVSKMKSLKPFGRILFLDGIQDPGNMGTIIRSAVAFNIDTIILSNSVSIYNPKVLRATEGMIFHINIVEAKVEEILPKLKKDGYTIYITDVNGGTDLKKVNFSSKSAIIIGNEGNGVSEITKSFSDERLYISMNTNCESLNAAVATSIILYELDK